MIEKIKKLFGCKRENKATENFYIRVIEYGMKEPDGFTYNEVVNSSELNLNNREKEIIKKYFNNAYINSYRDESKSRSGGTETLFLVVNRSGTAFDQDSNKYVINIDSYFKYLDYQELKLARQNARTARNLSLAAIGIAALSIIIAILVPIFIKQTVKLDTSQFEKILNSAK